MAYEMIDLTKAIEVKSGDYRRKWQKATIESITLGNTHCYECSNWESEEEKEEYYSHHNFRNHTQINLNVRFEDGTVQSVSDCFGRQKDEWRYV